MVYAGYLVGVDGTKVDPEKISGITKFPKSGNLTDLRSFMGLVQQFSDFSAEIHEKALPLRDLLKPTNQFLWTMDHDKAFEDVKKALVSPPTLAQFDPTLPTVLQTDASRRNGLGFNLMQKHGQQWKLVMAGSRFLTPTESRYAMCELELLAIVWAVTKKCKLFLQGLPQFTIQTDHRPLLPIINQQTLD